MTGASATTTSRRAFACAMVAALSGCAPEAEYASPDFPFMPYYRGASSAPVLLDNVAWWQRLEDPVPDRLIRLALQDSVSIAAARTRIEAAEARRASVPGAAILSPSVGVRVEGTEDSGPDLTAPARIGLTWMRDPWGENRDRLRAADARIDAADAELDAARLLLLYSISNAYLDLRYRQRLLVLAQIERTSRTETLRLTSAFFAVEEATLLDLRRAEGRVAESGADLPALAAAVTATQNQIAVLAGVAPGTLPPNLAAALDGGGQPIPALSPEVGIPADLLRNRPDILIAKRRYAAAVADIGVARADLYPSLSLSGAITLDALGGGMDYFFGPALQVPTLPGAAPRAAVAVRDAEARGIFEDWRGTVLDAILEVENALVQYDTATSATKAASRLYGEARDFTRVVYEKRDAAWGDLIDAESAIASADRRLADLRCQRARTFVELNVALGTGHAAGAPP